MAKNKYPGLQDVYELAEEAKKEVKIIFSRPDISGIYPVTVTVGGIYLEGPYYFSFDKKRIFNFWSDYPDKLTPDQIKLFNKYNPILAELKGYGGYPPEDESETE